jgi:hypothetical protein
MKTSCTQCNTLEYSSYRRTLSVQKTLRLKEMMPKVVNKILQNLCAVALLSELVSNLHVCRCNHQPKMQGISRSVIQCSLGMKRVPTHIHIYK